MLRYHRSFIMCLERPDAATSTVVLRVLLTLKNSLRCQSNNSSAVSRWLADNPKMGKLLKRLATSASARQQQATKRSGATTSEQIVKTAADIVRLCDAISPPRQS
jgi:cystathionine beta-lyase/cystathionine gamma-synthase